MKKAKINFDPFTAAKLLVKGNQIITAIKGSPHFSNPIPSPAALQAQLDKLSEAIDKSADKGRASLAIVRMYKRETTVMLHTLGEYVNSIASGDETILLTSGFDLTKTPEKNRKPEPVTKLEAVFTNKEGRIDLIWKRSKKARYYNVFMSADGGANWNLLNTTLGRKLLVEALASGKRYQFKVVAVNVSGKSPESEIATQVAA